MWSRGCPTCRGRGRQLHSLPAARGVRPPLSRPAPSQLSRRRLLTALPTPVGFPAARQLPAPSICPPTLCSFPPHAFDRRGELDQSAQKSRRPALPTRFLKATCIQICALCLLMPLAGGASWSSARAWRATTACAASCPTAASTTASRTSFTGRSEWESFETKVKDQFYWEE